MKTKRRDRLEAEQKANPFNKNRAQERPAPEIRKGENKKNRLKKEIHQMWVELENTFSNNEVTQMEDTLKAEKLHLLEIY